MIGLGELLLSYLRRQIGLRTDKIDPSGSLNARVRALMALPYWLHTLSGEGADGTFSPGGNTSIGGRIYRFDSVTIGSGITVSISNKCIVIVSNGDIVINGLLTATGAGGAGGDGPDATNAPGGNGANGANLAGSGGGGGGTAKDAGGAGGSTHLNGGNGGTADNVTPAGAGNGGYVPLDFGIPNDLKEIAYSFGGGGGGGACKDNTYGSGHAGHGGAGGGGIIIYSRTKITGSGAIRADGVNGGNGTCIYGDEAGGGGGGGGGGLIIAIAPTIDIPTISATGGTGGTGQGCGTYGKGYNGADGGDGLVFKWVI